MKKFFLSIFAVVALLSCSKSDITYDNQETQIGFSPVANNITKSVAGIGTNGNYDATFPTTLNLYVFANAQADNLTASWPSSYFQNAKFIYSRLNNGVYEGDVARFWPNIKSLIFAGYSNACNIDDITANSSVDFGKNEITITGYTQDNTKTDKGANDLMWFPWDTKSYTKQNTAVTANMKHACSWITVKVKSDGNYTDLKLHDLTINGLYHTGTAKCGATAATWTDLGSISTENLYLNNTGADLSTTEVAFENTANNMIVIPQKPTSIDVTYSFVPQTGIAAIKETKTGLSLSIGKEIVEGVEQDKLWESGKHYIYTITITATEILIAPEVAEWTNTPVTPGISI